MRLLAFQNKLTTVNGRQVWRPVSNPNIFQDVRDKYPEFAYLINPLERALKAKIGEQNTDQASFKQTHLLITPNAVARDSERTVQCLVQFQNQLLADLHALFQENLGVSEHLRLVLTVGVPGTENSIEVTDFKPRSRRVYEGVLEDHSVYTKSGVVLPKEIFSNACCYASIAIDIDIPNPYPYPRKPPVLPVAESEKIFHDKTIPRDVNIITMEGCKVPCHWFHLVGHSNVFLSMLTFTAEMDQNKQYELQLRGMTEKAVNALLEYIYLGKLTEAENDSKIAMELLDAAELYKIDALFETMQAMFMEKTDEWIGLEVAIKLYRFTKQFFMLEELQKLFVRVDYMLWSKGQEEVEQYVQSNEDLFGKDFRKKLLWNLFGDREDLEKVKMDQEVPAGQ